MLVLLVMSLAAAAADVYRNNSADNQLPMFKEKTMGYNRLLTTSSGAPVEYKKAMEVLNSELLDNEYFLETITHLNRERTLERMVHAKGTGAFGYFEVTNDISHICNAQLFSAVGKKTPVVVRLSVVAGERGGSDTPRDARGFAIKFYTEEGNFDLLTLNREVFVIKDPIFFPIFTHVFKRNPRTNIKQDYNAIWDFLTLRPESLNNLMIEFGDRGIPDGYRHMPGFAIHAFELVNDNGNKSYAKFHILPDSGIKNLNSSEGARIAGEDPDYAIRDLYNAIANGEYPTWTISIQVVTMRDIETAKFDLFDITKYWPLDEYPLIPIGRLVLNENPTNHFADIEQLAFCPSNLVPGIMGGVEKVFQARRFAYKDAQRYRLGANFNKIAVNCPVRAFTYLRDGVPPVKDNEGESPNYYPNSFNGPMPIKKEERTDLLKVYIDPNANNFDQAGEQYANMNEGERRRLVENIVFSLSRADKFLQERAIVLYYIIDKELADRISESLLAKRATN